MLTFISLLLLSKYLLKLFSGTILLFVLEHAVPAFFAVNLSTEKFCRFALQYSYCHNAVDINRIKHQQYTALFYYVSVKLIHAPYSTSFNHVCGYCHELLLY